MKIEMLPELRCKELDGSVECRCTGNDDAEQSGVDGVDVVEMNDVCFFLEYFPQEITRPKETHNYQENDEMRIGEG